MPRLYRMEWAFGRLTPISLSLSFHCRVRSVKVVGLLVTFLTKKTDTGPRKLWAESQSAELRSELVSERRAGHEALLHAHNLGRCNGLSGIER